jgi:large subunit ribosomal protein L4
MKIELFDTKLNKTQEMTLNKDIFDVEPKDQVLAQYIRVYLANQRQGTSSTKTRSEVSGSGIKPWAQKGTGRARVGSKRTPLWRHGGIVHGPKPKSWNLDISKDLKSTALLTAILGKINDKTALVVSSFDNLTGKTKDASTLLKTLKLERNTLVVVDTVTSEISKSLRNIKNIDLADSARLNAYQVVKAHNVIFSKAAIEKLEERLGGN